MPATQSADSSVIDCSVVLLPLQLSVVAPLSVRLFCTACGERAKCEQANPVAGGWPRPGGGCAGPRRARMAVALMPAETQKASETACKGKAGVGPRQRGSPWAPALTAGCADGLAAAAA